MNKIYILFLLFVAGMFTTAAQTTWRADVAHSKVQFTISHMVISEVSGRFQDFDATLIQTKDDFSEGKLNATIKVTSINTDNEKRDGHLKSPDFFDAEKYAEITFVSKSIKATGKDTYKIAGDLTMHGITKPVVLDTKFNGQIVGPMGNTISGFKATTTVNRKDFGIIWNKTLEAGGLLVGEDVDVVIIIEMTKEKK
jgi:polyisoprenoid-binding protein YceI